MAHENFGFSRTVQYVTWRRWNLWTEG